MLYQEYKQRLEKCLHVFGGLWRFRYLILAILAVLVALIGVLLGITGNVYRVRCPETIEYGAEYEIEGNAVFREATVQYRAENAKEWVEDRPILVGTYEVRAVSRGISGKIKIGDTSFFRIVPKTAEIRVEEASFLYGGSPSATVDLAYEDDLDGESFEYEWKDPDRCVVTPHVERVLDERGEDVTHCYSLVPTPREVSVLPRPITIVTAGATKVYDGEPLRAEQYELTEGTFVNGETLDVSFTASIVSAGECENIPVCTVRSADGKDVTEHYAFTIDAGTLKVTPKPIAVKTASHTWIHDGEPHRWDGPGQYEVEGLIGEHRAFVRDSIELTEITDTEDEVRYLDNVISIGVMDAEGNDVTQNYEIAYEYGKLRIKTEILLTVYSVQKIYDGTPLMFEDGDFYVIEPPDVSVDLDLTGFHLTDAGSLPLSAVFGAPISVTDRITGVDVRSENRWKFLGDPDEPILTVERRKLGITSKSISTVRNGRTLKGGEGTYSAWISFGTLAKGHTIEIEVTGTLSPLSNHADNTISSVRIFDALSVDVTLNYEIELHPGVLEWISGSR